MQMIAAAPTMARVGFGCVDCMLLHALRWVYCRQAGAGGVVGRWAVGAREEGWDSVGLRIAHAWEKIHTNHA